MLQYAIQKVNGQPVQVPVRADGTIDIDDLCRAAQVAPNRALVLQQPDGTNQIVPRGHRVRVDPRACFIDAPLHTRGR